ncbi:hypothetical protein DFQ26_008987 [Actinomortierella ambigua]|nr:hypothetical protein DFQ26_008987 [Actinomortierella ambigua]
MKTALLATPKGRAVTAINQRGVCGVLTEFFNRFEQQWKSERLSLITNVLTTEDQVRLLCQCSTMLMGHIPIIKDFVQQKCEPVVHDLSCSITPSLSSVITHLDCAQKSRSLNCLTILKEITTFLADTKALVMDVPLNLVNHMLNDEYSVQLLYLQSQGSSSSTTTTATSSTCFMSENDDNNDDNDSDHDSGSTAHSGLGEVVHPSIVSIAKLCELWGEALEYSRSMVAPFGLQAEDYLAMANVLARLRDRWEIEGGMLDFSSTQSGGRSRNGRGTGNGAGAGNGSSGSSNSIGRRGEDDGDDEETAVDRILRILNKRARECKIALYRKQIEREQEQESVTQKQQQQQQQQQMGRKRHPQEALRLQALARKYHLQHQQLQGDQLQDLRPSWALNSSLPRQRHSISHHSPSNVGTNTAAVATAANTICEDTVSNGEAEREDADDAGGDADESLLDHSNREAIAIKMEEGSVPTLASTALSTMDDSLSLTKIKSELAPPSVNEAGIGIGINNEDSNDDDAAEWEQGTEPPPHANDDYNEPIEHCTTTSNAPSPPRISDISEGTVAAHTAEDQISGEDRERVDDDDDDNDDGDSGEEEEADHAILPVSSIGSALKRRREPSEEENGMFAEEEEEEEEEEVELSSVRLVSGGGAPPMDGRGMAVDSGYRHADNTHHYPKELDAALSPSTTLVGSNTSINMGPSQCPDGATGMSMLIVSKGITGISMLEEPRVLRSSVLLRSLTKAITFSSPPLDTLPHPTPPARTASKKRRLQSETDDDHRDEIALGLAEQSSIISNSIHDQPAGGGSVETPSVSAPIQEDIEECPDEKGVETATTTTTIATTTTATTTAEALAPIAAQATHEEAQERSVEPVSPDATSEEPPQDAAASTAISTPTVSTPTVTMAIEQEEQPPQQDAPPRLIEGSVMSRSALQRKLALRRHLNKLLTDQEKNFSVPRHLPRHQRACKMMEKRKMEPLMDKSKERGVLLVKKSARVWRPPCPPRPQRQKSQRSRKTTTTTRVGRQVKKSA